MLDASSSHGYVSGACRQCGSWRKNVDKIRLSATILRRINCCTKNSIQRGACPIILPSAVAIRRTATRLTSSTLTADSTQSAEKTGSTFSFRLKRLNGTRTIPTAETTCALPRPTAPTHPMSCSVLHWEALHEIRIGEWQDAVPANFLCAVLRANWRRLSAKYQHAALLLRR